MSPARTRRTSSASLDAIASIPMRHPNASQLRRHNGSVEMGVVERRRQNGVSGGDVRATPTGIQCDDTPCRNSPRRNLTMSRLSLALLAVASIAAACYKDDTNPNAPQNRKPMAKVFLTDAPFPFDSVQSVKVYIVSIAVSTHPDTGT